MKNYATFRATLTKLAALSNTPDLIQQLTDLEASGDIFIASIPDEFFVAIKSVVQNGENIMFVWIGIGLKPNTLKAYLPYFIEMAKEGGCKAIEFESTRKGFSRIAKSIGFTNTGKRGIYDIYRKEV
jgi:hypothetical protein